MLDAIKGVIEDLVEARDNPKTSEHVPQDLIEKSIKAVAYGMVQSHSNYKDICLSLCKASIAAMASSGSLPPAVMNDEKAMKMNIQMLYLSMGAAFQAGLIVGRTTSGEEKKDGQ
ncbi:MAG: hypothetical protein WC291_00260 [Thermodesulfovibrionales bacterium]|jgi:hypothetical protein